MITPKLPQPLARLAFSRKLKPSRTTLIPIFLSCMKLLPRLSGAALLLLALPSFAQFHAIENKTPRPPRRVALVVGNNNYETSPLLNPVNDARDIAQALDELKFEVNYQSNLGYKEMKTAIRESGESVAPSSLSFVVPSAGTL